MVLTNNHIHLFFSVQPEKVSSFLSSPTYMYLEHQNKFICLTRSHISIHTPSFSRILLCATRPARSTTPPKLEHFMLRKTKQFDDINRENHDIIKLCSNFGLKFNLLCLLCIKNMLA